MCGGGEGLHEYVWMHGAFVKTSMRAPATATAAQCPPITCVSKQQRRRGMRLECRHGVAAVACRDVALMQVRALQHVALR